MCDRYSVTSNREAIRACAGVMAENDSTGNMPLLPSIFPDYAAPSPWCTDPPRSRIVHGLSGRQVNAGTARRDRCGTACERIAAAENPMSGLLHQTDHWTNELHF
jgi:hypothetical protein